MPPKSKSTVSSSSFLDLKAEISRHKEEMSRNKAAGAANPRHMGDRPDPSKRKPKITTIWSRPNKGVNARASRDIELEAISKPTLDSARVALERKAKIYDKLQRGKTGGLNDAQFDMLLVDFDAKGPSGQFESDSEDEDESLQVPSIPEQSDPIVEYEDEFGRMRTARRSEVPRELLPREVDEDEDLIIHNPKNHFPIYEPSSERLSAIEKQFSDANNPLNVHYDAEREARAKGAGFYQFSLDEETRKKQMEELKQEREETKIGREEMGAADVSAEGMQATDVSSGKSKAMEKRKREIEERRKAVDAKRRKKMGSGQADVDLQAESSSATTSNAPLPPPADPFALLESTAPLESNARSKGKEKEKSVTAADDFLAQLEADLSRS